ncbi:MAG: polysaccharide biosynthesis/export family protein [Desulfobacteraceae bacterium]|jgi:polysaccharide export outer membrane protein
MKKTLLMLVVLFIAACSAKNPDIAAEFRKSPAPGQSYRIGCGDVLMISAWKEEALSRQASVLPDGNITFPLIGEIKAKGSTINELKKTMEEKLSVYMPGAILSVQVLQSNSMVIYVVGKVNAPGQYPIHENVTVMQALTMARGLNPFADKDEIRIFRNVDGTEKIFYFNYTDVARGINLEQNIRLERGDLIVVQ